MTKTIANEYPNFDQAKIARVNDFVYEVVDRVIFDLLVNSAANKTIKGMSEILIKILSQNLSCVETLFKQRVFRPEEKLGKDERNYFEMLATHQDRNVRELASSVLIEAISILNQSESEEH